MKKILRLAYEKSHVIDGNPPFFTIFQTFYGFFRYSSNLVSFPYLFFLPIHQSCLKILSSCWQLPSQSLHTFRNTPANWSLKASRLYSNKHDFILYWYLDSLSSTLFYLQIVQPELDIIFYDNGQNLLKNGFVMNK